jgi:hypothetical protein
LTLVWLDNHVFTVEQVWCTYCWSLLLAWWIVYFNHRRFGVVNLRRFLSEKNPFRRDGTFMPIVNDPEARKENERRIQAKGASSIGAQGVQIAIVAFMLSAVLAAERTGYYAEAVRPAVVVLALFTLLLLCFSIDILDTAVNIFEPGNHQDEQHYPQLFYRRVGPKVPKGGAGYAYMGFAALSVFLVVAVSFFYVALGGVGVAVYVYLGYPYLFGYFVNPEGRVEYDDRSDGPASVLGAVILAVTIAVHYA